MKIYKYILIVSGVVVLALVVWAIIAWRNNPESIPAPSGTATVESQANTNSAENAENLEFIKSALKDKSIVPDWISSNCVYAYTSTEEDSQTVDIRERHTGEGCEVGDPNVSPRIDSFRLKDGAVEWFDSLFGDYKSLDAYRAYLNSLPG